LQLALVAPNIAVPHTLPEAEMTSTVAWHPETGGWVIAA
jgi:hypothetical protein